MWWWCPCTWRALKHLSCRYLVEAGEVDGGLVAKPLGAFVRAVGARSAAPGGGSVSAAVGALVCAPRQDRGLGVLGAPRGAGMVVAVGTVSYWSIYPGREQRWAAWWG